ncbi:ABC transporter ATP-binding protein [Bosea vestrisii]|uniref:ABC transporter ATP-binding protein n=1 Tax=Bosea vestrisii TaxID=151416 RepID=A0ABW0H742_9HYPH
MSDQPVLEARNVARHFDTRSGMFGRPKILKAVDGINLTVQSGEVLALVGESGSGKTTLAKLLLGLTKPTSGELYFTGTPLDRLERKGVARQVQAIFQDPYSSLNPRKTLEAIISLPLRVHGIGSRDEQHRMVRDIMERVGLPSRLLTVYPNQLSGGQRQRVAIARALIMRPSMVICDEPTSALDVSVQSQILNLLQELQRELGLTYLLITHNLAVVEHIATRVAVMYLGRIVEEAETRSFFAGPRHPYSKALLESVLTPEPGRGLPQDLLGASFPNPVDPPSGCPFHPRCPERMPVCEEAYPAPLDDGAGKVACHRALATLSMPHATPSQYTVTGS